MEICSFRLVLEGKTGKEIPESSKLEFLEKLLGNNFVLSDEEDNTSGALNREGIVDLPLLRLLNSNSPKPKFLGSDGLFWYSSTYKFGSFKNLFAIITCLYKLYFRFRKFILLMQMKKMISMNYDSCISC